MGPAGAGEVGGGGAQRCWERKKKRGSARPTRRIVARGDKSVPTMNRESLANAAKV